jgi:Skp family chaperone for outer membrane proteins
MSTQKKAKVNKTRHNLTEKNEKILVTVLAARNVAEGCAQAGISRSRWYQLMKQEAFKTAYQEMTTEIARSTLHELKASMGSALREIKKMATANITDVVHFNESGASFVHNSEDIPPDLAAAIKSIEVTEEATGDEKDRRFVLKTRVQMHDKLRANELLLEKGTRLLEIDELIKRVDEIKERLEGKL